MGKASIKVDREKVRKNIENRELKELKKEARKVFGIANKRISRIESANGVYSPALSALKKRRVAKFTISGKNYKELAKEVAEAEAFNQLETSTLTGARAYTSQIIRTVNTENPFIIRQVYDLLDMLQERLPPDIYGRFIDTNKEMQKIVDAVNSRTDIDLSEYTLESNEKEEVLQKVIDEINDDFNRKIEEQKRFLESSSDEDFVGVYQDETDGFFD